MIESRCGILCSQCDFFKNQTCQGCLKIAKPFWSDMFWDQTAPDTKLRTLALAHNSAQKGNCPVKACCETKELENCGQCQVFPCELALGMAYDSEQGDQGLRLKQCQDWKQK